MTDEYRGLWGGGEAKKKGMDKINESKVVFLWRKNGGGREGMRKTADRQREKGSKTETKGVSLKIITREL